MKNILGRSTHDWFEDHSFPWANPILAPGSRPGGSTFRSRSRWRPLCVTWLFYIGSKHPDEFAWVDNLSVHGWSEFSADHGIVNLEKGCNFRLFKSCFQKYVNLVSLFLGKLHVRSHTVCRCSADVGAPLTWWSMEYRCYCRLHLIPTFKVAHASWIYVS